MKQFVNKKGSLLFPILLLLAVAIGIGGYIQYAGAAAEPITLNKIDYDNMELTLNARGNAIIYYSTNKTKWYEADGAFAIDDITTGETNDMGSATVTYDISWVSTGSTKLYFRGNVNTTTLSVVIPAYNKSFKVKFDKANGNFDFDNTDDAELIRWRKSTDYTWNYVWANRDKAGITMDSTQADYNKYNFDKDTEIQSLDDLEQNVIPNFRVKGTKLIFQTVPVIGKDGAEGIRPSKEVSVKIPAKKAAPSIKVNIKKLTVNTTTKQEYTKTNGSGAVWQTCTKTMDLNDLASSAVNGTASETIYFRTSATTSNCESKVATLVVPKREAAPTAPFTLNQVPPASASKAAKANVIFTNVPSEGYEYTIIKNGTALDEKTASWKTIKKAKTVKFTEKSLPAGAKIYVRVKGVSANVSKGIELKLPSLCFDFPVPSYPMTASS